MTRNAPAAMDRARAQIYRAMTPAGQELAVLIGTKLSGQAMGNILTAHIIGARLAAAHDHEGMYGTNYIDQVAEFFKIPGGARTLYSYIELSKAFSAEYLRAQSTRLMASGRSLGVDHWLALMRVDCPKDRELLLERTLSESWSSTELRCEIDARGANARKPRGPGRRPKAPTSPIAGLQAFYQRATKIVHLGDLLHTSVFDPIEQMSAEKVSEALLSRLLKVQTRANDLRDVAAAVVERIGSSVEHVRRLFASAVGANGAPENLEETPKAERPADKKRRR